MKNLIIITFLIFLLLISCTPKTEVSINSSDITNYDVVFRESLAGNYKKWVLGENSFGFSYQYTDRGRGPNFQEEITLNKKKYIVKHSTIGVNYLKDSIHENFTSNEKTALWMNPGGEDKDIFNGNELYFRYDGSPAIYEILANLLLTSNTKKINLYPEGNVQLIKKVSLNIGNNVPANLLMIKGLDIKPTYIWMNDDQMICRINGNLHVVREDMKTHRLQMKVLQDSIEDDYLFNLSKKLSHKFKKVVIKNVNVFTKQGTLILNQDVFVEENTIKEIRSNDQKNLINGIKIIDGTGKTLMPGMFDSHTHNNKFRGALHLAGGVTSVRDLANNKQLKKLSNRFNNNEIIGPRIVTFSGIIDGPGPFANQRNVVNNLEEGLREIQEYKKLGYQQIKLYSSIKPEWVRPLIEEAHNIGMKVSGHIPAFMTASKAIESGYDEIQHMNMLFLNFLSDTIDTRTPLRFTMVAKHGANLDLKSDEYLDFIELLKSNETLIDPTVSIFENMFVSKKGEPSPTFKKIINRLPLINQRKYYSGGLPKPRGQEENYIKSFDKMLDVIFDLYQKGVGIVPGTDGLPGFLFHRELELYEKSGIPSAEVLKLATIKAAEIIGVSNLFGSIEVGKQADLILIDGNPIKDISELRNIEWTMKGGNIYYSKELYASMGIKHYK